jgi:hypothetical protein
MEIKGETCIPEDMSPARSKDASAAKASFRFSSGESCCALVGNPIRQSKSSVHSIKPYWQGWDYYTRIVRGLPIMSRIPSPC